MNTPLPARETERLRRLAQYDILDTPAEPAYDNLARLAAQICDAPIALISFVAAEREWFKAHLGFPLRGMPREHAVCAHALLEERVLVVPDLRDDPRFADNPLLHAQRPVRFYAGALLLTADGLPLGTLCVMDHRPRTLDADALWALTALSDQVMAQLELRERERDLDRVRCLAPRIAPAPAPDPQTALAVAERERLALLSILEDQREAERQLRVYARRLQELSQRMVEVEETEKRNIGRDLHDHIGSALAALNLTLDIAFERLHPDGRAAALVLDAKAQAQTTVRELRNILDTLRPPALDDFGLLAALREYAVPFARRVGVDIDVAGNEPEPRPPLAAETALFRIAQEALNNAARHSDCTRLVVRLGHDGHGLTLRVADNGRGFDPERAQAGWGLTTMRERAEAIGARFLVDSSANAGTEVRVSLDVEEHDDPIAAR